MSACYCNDVCSNSFTPDKEHFNLHQRNVAASIWSRYRFVMLQFLAKIQNKNVSLISSHQFAHSGRSLEQPELFPALVSWLNWAIAGEHGFKDVTKDPKVKVAHDSESQTFSALMQLRLNFVALILSIVFGGNGDLKTAAQPQSWTDLIQLERLCREGWQKMPKSRFAEAHPTQGDWRLECCQRGSNSTEQKSRNIDAVFRFFLYIFIYFFIFSLFFLGT